jgi:hypothetical protein
MAKNDKGFLEVKPVARHETGGAAAAMAAAGLIEPRAVDDKHGPVLFAAL